MNLMKLVKASHLIRHKLKVNFLFFVVVITANIKIKFLFNIKEALYYRKLFTEMYPNCDHFTPYIWLPKWYALKFLKLYFNLKKYYKWRF